MGLLKAEQKRKLIKQKIYKYYSIAYIFLYNYYKTTSRIFHRMTKS